MTRASTLLVVIALLVGCNRSNSSHSSATYEIIEVSSEDVEMNAAMQTARDSFPKFWREVSSDFRRVPPAPDSSMVKAYFEDSEGPSGRGEHMWVSEINFDGKIISGVLRSTPDHLRSVKAGQWVSFPLEKLSDWFYVDDGKAVGAFTVQLLRARMSEEERRAHDSHYPFRLE